jgi:hypothetical protein
VISYNSTQATLLIKHETDLKIPDAAPSDCERLKCEYLCIPGTAESPSLCHCPDYYRQSEIDQTCLAFQNHYVYLATKNIIYKLGSKLQNF